ncbi:MAG TPA: NAD(P)H-binding protein [Erysipelotrichaceae bacterium]|jgi:uncharacterized protein YbjT (DUF2867 family)|nr:NAD(P)H-binding protein [Erysipelotrichaceae bacterium]HQB31879.1 NAD(P)H-binding protein [Erysipelotrichaceae bacterium]
MKIVLAGAFGNLGFEVLKQLVEKGYEVIAADLKEKANNGYEGRYAFKEIDATRPETLKGLFDKADLAISTVGLTSASTRYSAYDIDYQGNLNLFNEAKSAKVKKFNYISVIACERPGAEKVPMLHAKWLFEEELRKSGMAHIIYRPTGYFYDIAKVFRPYIDNGEMQLLKGYGTIKANVVACEDFAAFILEHMNDEGNPIYEVGGKETYTYEEMAKLCFEAAGKETKIKYAPPWLFNVLANLPKIKKEGKRDIILFSKWTLTNDLVGRDVTGEASFKEYIDNYFGGKSW